MTNIPSNLRYSSNHTWVEVLEDDSVRIGITDFFPTRAGGDQLCRVTGFRTELYSRKGMCCN